MRVTHAMVHSVFQIYCETFGFPLLTKERLPGSYFVDYAPCYGGWRISELLASTGIRDVHHERYSTKEFYYMLSFAIRTESERKYREQNK